MTTFQKIMHTMDYLADGMADMLRTGKFHDKILSYDTEHAKSNYNVYKSRWNTNKNEKASKQSENKVKAVNNKPVQKENILKSVIHNAFFKPEGERREREQMVTKLEKAYAQRNEKKQEVKQEAPKQEVAKNPEQKSLHHVAAAELHKISQMQNQVKEAEKTREDKTRTPGEQFVMKHGIKDEKQIEQLGKRADDYIVEGHEKIENFTNRSGMDKGLDTMERSLNQTEKNAPDHAQQMEM